MIQVSTQAELQAAINASEPDIEVTAGFYINSPLNIRYAASITSGAGGPYTLTKADDYNGSLFTLEDNGSLNLQNIILDGAKETHTLLNDSASLISLRQANLTLGTGVILQNNISGRGGAVYCANVAVFPPRLIVQGNAVIRGNYSQMNGGGIYAIGSTVQISGQAVIEDNETDADGGGVFFQSDRQDIFTISGNVKITGNRADSGGGIIAFLSNLTVTGNVEISDNQATGYGGGISFSGNNLLIDENVSIFNNHAGIGGGIGIYSSLNPTNIAIHGLLRSNSADNGGGLVLGSVSSGTVNLSGAQFIENQAISAENGNGGGLIVYPSQTTALTVSLLLTNTIFRSNHADNGGGALFFYSGGPIFDVQMTGCAFEANSAGHSGGALSVDNNQRSVWLIQQSTFTQNHAESGGSLFFNNTRTQGPVTLEDVSLSGNTASVNGGAICLANVYGNSCMILDLNHVIIDSNTAGRNGGAVYIENASGQMILRENTQIKNNIASFGQGGAIYQYRTDYQLGDRVLQITGAVLEDNTARLTGKGIYNANQLKLGMSVIESDGLYITEEFAAPTIIQHFTEGSFIQLEHSAYVTPNQTGTPVIIARADFPLTASDAAVFRKPTIGFDGWQIRLSDRGTEVVLAVVIYALQYENTKGSQNLNPLSYTVITPTITLAGLADTADYRFDGWFDALEGGTQVTAIPLGSTGDRILYAHWHALNHTLTYYGNDEGGTPAENVPLPQPVQEGEDVIVSSELPTRTGYVFAGWNTTSAGSGTAYQPGDTIANVTTDIELYAQWEIVPPTLHLLTYEPNDAEGPAAEGIPEQQEITEGSITELSSGIPTRLGYRFQSWNSSPLGTGTIYQPGQTVGPVNEDITIYAQWQRVAHTLTYHGNDAGGPDARDIPDPQAIYEDQAVLLSDTLPTREGYLFTGWNSEPNGGGTSYQPGDSFGPSAADADLYAQWQALPAILHLLTYEANDAEGPSAEGIPEQQEIPEGKTTELSSAIPTRIGYKFIGWNSEPDGTGMEYQPGQTVGPFYADLTIYAQWAAVPPGTYTLTYYANDEGGPAAKDIPVPVLVQEGQSVTLSSIIPTRERFTFSGWNTESSGIGTAYQPGDTISEVKADITLYAQWIPLPTPACYTLTYSGNDAGGPPAHCIPCDESIPAGCCSRVSCIRPHRSCYRFDGWNTNPHGTGQKYCPGQHIGPVDEDICLYAQWKRPCPCN